MMARRSCEGGFSLIEVGVVMALIALLAAGLGLALGGGGRGAAQRAGESTLAGFVSAARQNALLHGAEVRMLVANDDDDLESYRRHVGLIVQATDERGFPIANTWQALSDGVWLPRGVRVAVDGARGDAMAGHEMALDFPRAGPVVAGGGTPWHYLRFDARGRCLTPGVVALAPGSPASGEGGDVPPEVARTGFMVFRLGGIARMEGGW